MMEKEFKYIISEKFDNFTIESFFLSFHFGKDKVNSCLFNGKIKLNGKIVDNKAETLQKNDVLTITFLYKENNKYKIVINVVYEDEYIIVVNKPQGILIHTDGNTDNTLTNAVLNYLNEKEEKPYAYPVHRIDYDTTGIVIFAKDPLTLSYLSFEIEKHTFLKEYICLCYGKFEVLEGIINKKIGKNRHNNKQIISKTGKTAISKFKVLENDKVSKVLVEIQHGRKHQIRIHLSSINHPIIGDSLYGKNDKKKLKLHFRRVIFFHPFILKKMEIYCEENFK